MRFTAFVLLALAPMAAADCFGSLETLSSDYAIQLLSLVTSPTTSTQSICESDAWPAMEELFREAADACVNEANNLAGAELGPLMKMLQKLPCYTRETDAGDTQYCWASFGNILRRPATALLTVVGRPGFTVEDVLAVDLDFSVDDTTRAGICGAQVLDCFEDMSQMIVYEVGQLDSSVSEVNSAKEIFLQYAADITDTCIKDEASTNGEYCKDYFYEVFPTGTLNTSVDPDMFCTEDGKLNHCIEMMTARLEVFGQADSATVTGESLCQICDIRASATGGELATFEIGISLFLENLSPTYVEANMDAFKLTARKALAYEFLYLWNWFTIDAVEVQDDGVLVEATLNIPACAQAQLEAEIEKLTALVTRLLSQVQSGDFVLPSLEFLPGNAKIDSTQRITIDFSRSAISFTPPSIPTTTVAPVSPGGSNDDGSNDEGINSATTTTPAIALLVAGAAALFAL